MSTRNRKSLGSGLVGIVAAATLLAVSVPALAGPEAGERTFTIAGTGGSDQDFNNNTFGFSGQLGWFLSAQTEVGVRQSAAFVAIDGGDDSWAGSTRGFADYHFGSGEVLPYIGANLGGVYGEDVNETLSAGLEAGLKWYVKEKTFIALQAEYQFLFDDADEFDNRFGDGAVFYTLGVGFNF
ncbi:MAG: hypothetical protein RIC56_11050 [Pseudomonadales bacterium]